MNKTFKILAIASLALTLCGTAHANEVNTRASSVKSSAQAVNLSDTVQATQHADKAQQAKDAAPKTGEITRRRVVIDSATRPNTSTRIVNRGHMVIVPHTSNDDMTIYGPKPTQLSAGGNIPNYYKN